MIKSFKVVCPLTQKTVFDIPVRDLGPNCSDSDCEQYARNIACTMAQKALGKHFNLRVVRR